MILAPAARALNRAMTMRMTVERNVENGKNAYNTPKPPNYQPHLADQRCRVWSESKREDAGDGRTIVIDDLRAIVPLGTDIRRTDRITEVRTSNGAVFMEGKIEVDSVVPRLTHLELVLREVSA